MGGYGTVPVAVRVVITASIVRKGVPLMARCTRYGDGVLVDVTIVNREGCDDWHCLERQWSGAVNRRRLPLPSPPASLTL